MSVITTRDLTKQFPGVTALDSLDIEIETGVTGLVGANGAGKSTLIKILLGLLPPTSGGAAVLGKNVDTDGLAIRASVGYMPEHDCLPPDVSATEFVVHMAKVSGLPAAAARERTADTLRHVGLYEERYRSIGGYSTGMRQRVKLAQALVHDPQLVLLDEPTNGLDPAGRDEMLELIRRIGADFGISVLVSSHLLGELERICDAVVVIDGGRLLRSFTTADFLQVTGSLRVEVLEFDPVEEPVARPSPESLAPTAASAPGESPAERLARALTAAGQQVRAVDTRVLDVQIDGDATFDAVRDETAKLGFGLVRMQQSRHRIEEVFQ